MPEDDTPPRLLRRVASLLRGEVPTAELEAFRQAGRGVYEAYLQSERLHAQLVRDGQHPFEAPAAASGQLLCTWNAYVLQVLGEALLDADAAFSPATRGWVAPMTAEQAWAYFVQVEPWLARARRAATDPGYRLTDEVEVPSPLPAAVVEDDPPLSHLHALAHAALEIGARADAALGSVLTAGPAPEGAAGRLPLLQGLAAEADSAASSAHALLAQEPGEDLREVVAVRLQDALEKRYELGQRLVLSRRLTAAADVTGEDGPGLPPLPLPGEDGFDPWCLSAPEALVQMASDERAVRAVESLWAADPEPARTLRLQAQLQAALRDGRVRRAVDAAGVPGHLHTCPWPPVYEAVRTVRLAGRRLRPLTQFALEVTSGDEGTGTFVRRVVVGPFTATRRPRYRGGAG